MSGSHLSYPSSILSLVGEFRLTPDKKRGQCFLIENNILDQIPVLTGVSSDELIIEIGSGPGNLTSRLCDSAGHVIAFETDRNFFPIYKKYFDGRNVDFHQLDFLKSDLGELINAALSKNSMLKKVKVVSNIPYYITSPIIEKLLYSGVEFSAIYLLMQTDVAERIIAMPKTKDYSILTVATNFAAEISLVKNISKNCFFPKPEIESSILKFVPLERRKFKSFEEYVFFGVLKAAFNQRRKVALNAISNNVARISEINSYPPEFISFASSPEFKAALTAAFEKHQISRLARAEEIECEKYAEIASFLSLAMREKAR
ncbi:MAG TPA: 16S rRNA (adenine(1518)-N(6)/adenine(1519)-N(6))-dimethyltransferase RsmA [Candidatus Wallbacteria bacterium]|nr:16S rRNA (adenine(1518)-N(6)/adenine(1519)-N(6))-dimethyltransferase RsmA [Candidatus Wallbacteria bacterium]